MADLVHLLTNKKLVAKSQLLTSILQHLDHINTVTDMASITGISTRQLQRKLKEITGFTPHNLLKVLRLQQSFQKDYHLLYTDQSHFIRSFKAITGYTPKDYFDNFDV
ncbi:MAG: AraC family transcriptional regulator [Micrococcaceae bacterium]